MRELYEHTILEISSDVLSRFRAFFRGRFVRKLANFRGLYALVLPIGEWRRESPFGEGGKVKGPRRWNVMDASLHFSNFLFSHKISN